MSEAKKAQVVLGMVVKVSAPQTIRVATKVTKVHPLYHKRYSQMRFYTVHDPESKAKVGDMVTITGCRPISKTKQWILL